MHWQVCLRCTAASGRELSKDRAPQKSAWWITKFSIDILRRHFYGMFWGRNMINITILRSLQRRSGRADRSAENKPHRSVRAENSAASCEKLVRCCGPSMFFFGDEYWWMLMNDGLWCFMVFLWLLWHETSRLLLGVFVFHSMAEITGAKLWHELKFPSPLWTLMIIGMDVILTGAIWGLLIIHDFIISQYIAYVFISLYILCISVYEYYTEWITTWYYCLYTCIVYVIVYIYIYTIYCTMWVRISLS